MDLLGTTTIFLVVCLVLLLAWKKVEAKRRNFPPGPTPLPFIGNLLQLKTKNTAEQMKKMSEKYGPVFTVYFGSDQVVVLYGYDVVKKILVESGDEFLDRGSFPSADKTNKGFGQAINPGTLFSCATGNVISHILLGERFDYQDKDYVRILRQLMESFRLESSVAGQLYNIFPRIMDYLPGSHQTFFANLFGVQDFIAQKVEEHERTFDPTSEPQDFLDAFLLKMEQEKNNPKTEFTKENLKMTMYDLFIAGTETTSTSLRYILMTLLEHPEVEGKIQEEIDRAIGRERTPAMKDRPEMPYTEAVIHEAQRFIDLIPLGFTRVVKKDMELEGFTIPKGATLYPILSSALHDPKQYTNPYKFNPEHFLDKDGRFKKNGADMPSSAGKRNCLGEGLARMQLFLYITTILQSFRLKYPPEVTKIDLTPDVSGFGNIPRQIPFCFSPR